MKVLNVLSFMLPLATVFVFFFCFGWNEDMHSWQPRNWNAVKFFPNNFILNFPGKGVKQQVHFERESRDGAADKCALKENQGT